MVILLLREKKRKKISVWFDINGSNINKNMNIFNKKIMLHNWEKEIKYLYAIIISNNNYY